MTDHEEPLETIAPGVATYVLLDESETEVERLALAAWQATEDGIAWDPHDREMYMTEVRAIMAALRVGR